MSSTKSGLIIMFTLFSVVLTILMGLVNADSAILESSGYTLESADIKGADALNTDKDTGGFFRNFVTNMKGAPLIVNIFIWTAYGSTLFLLITSLPFFNVN